MNLLVCHFALTLAVPFCTDVDKANSLHYNPIYSFWRRAGLCNRSRVTARLRDSAKQRLTGNA